MGGATSSLGFSLLLQSGRRLREIGKAGKDNIKATCAAMQALRLINSTVPEEAHLATYDAAPVGHLVGVLHQVPDVEDYSSLLLSAYRARPPPAYFYAQHPPDRGTPPDMQVHRELYGPDYSARPTPEAFCRAEAKFGARMKAVLRRLAPTASAYARLQRRFARSAATGDMAVFLLGIGDRHSENILIETRGPHIGRNLHIDLEYLHKAAAHVLPTPEVVPFRHTQNCRAGLGPLGDHGVFRTTATTVLSRAADLSQDVVLLLYSSDISGPHVAQREKELADRMHCVIDTAHMSAAYAVTTLCDRASDPKNLCRMFHGWRPYL
jgi:hypothetical protein